MLWPSQCTVAPVLPRNTCSVSKFASNKWKLNKPCAIQSVQPNTIAVRAWPLTTSFIFSQAASLLRLLPVQHTLLSLLIAGSHCSFNFTFLLQAFKYFTTIRSFSHSRNWASGHCHPTASSHLFLSWWRSRLFALFHSNLASSAVDYWMLTLAAGWEGTCALLNALFSRVHMLYKWLLFPKSGPGVLVSLHLLERFALYQL